MFMGLRAPPQRLMPADEVGPGTVFVAPAAGWGPAQVVTVLGASYPWRDTASLGLAI